MTSCRVPRSGQQSRLHTHIFTLPLILLLHWKCHGHDQFEWIDGITLGKIRIQVNYKKHNSLLLYDQLIFGAPETVALQCYTFHHTEIVWMLRHRVYHKTAPIHHDFFKSNQTNMPAITITTTNDISLRNLQESTVISSQALQETDATPVDMPTTEPVTVETVEEARECAPISLPLCSHLPYNVSTYPNLVGHQNKEALLKDLVAFRELLDAECSHLAQVK